LVHLFLWSLFWDYKIHHFGDHLYLPLSLLLLSKEAGITAKSGGFRRRIFKAWHIARYLRTGGSMCYQIWWLTWERRNPFVFNLSRRVLDGREHCTTTLWQAPLLPPSMHRGMVEGKIEVPSVLMRSFHNVLTWSKPKAEKV
jgi:hypothetical protein